MKTIVALLISAMVATAVLAQVSAPQTPPNPAERAQHEVKFLTTFLSLTAAQQQQATTIFNNAANSASSLHESMKTVHQNLENAVKNNDADGIDQAANTIGQLATQITSIEAKAHAAFYQILTPDQQNKLSQIESQGPVMMVHGPHPF